MLQTLLSCFFSKYKIIITMLQRVSMKFIAAFSLLLLFLQHSYSQMLTVSLSTRTINANSAYNFVIVDDKLQQHDGTITITFPSSKYTLTVVNCYDTRDALITFQCAVQATNQVAVTFIRGTFPNSYLQLSIATIKNPPYKENLQFVYTFASAGVVLTTINADADILSPDVLTSCSIVFNPAIVFSEGTITITIVTKNQVNADGSITLTFPSTWNQPVSSLSSPLIYSTNTCTKVSGNELKQNLPCAQFGTKISLANSMASVVPPGSSLVFTVAILQSPPTTSNTNAIVIGTQTSQGYQVDESSCKIAPVTEQTLILSSTSNFVIGNISTLSLTWNTASPLKSNDVLTITLPTSYMIFAAFNAAQLKYSVSKFPRIVGSIGNSSLQEKYTITSLSSGDTQIPNGAPLEFSNIPVNCQVDNSPRSVSLSISRGGFIISSGTFSITPQPNILRGVSITGDNNIVSAITSLKFSFLTWNSLPIDANIRIQIPSSITVVNANPACSISSSNNQASLAVAINCNINSNLLTVPAFLTAILPGSSNLALTVNSAFRNPQTSQPTSPFIIRTTSSSAASNNIVDQNIITTYSASAGTIGNVAILPASPVVGAQNTYTFDYTATRPIKAGSSIQIILPAEVVLSSSPSYSYSLNGGASSITAPTLSVVNGASSLLFVGLIPASLVVGDNLKISLVSIRNPLSMQPSSSFKVYISYNTFPVQNLQNGLIVTATTMSDFRQIQRQVINPTNGATQDYTFYIMPMIPILTNSIITMKIIDTTAGTNQITLTNPVNCALSTIGGDIPINCNGLGATITITLGGDMLDTTGNTQYTLVISSMVLARTLRPSSNFQFTSSINGFGVQSRTIQSIQNTRANKIQQISVSTISLPSQLNQNQQLSITIQTFNGINMLQGQYIIIYIPFSFTFSGGAVATICTPNIYTCTIYNGNNNAIKVQASGFFSTVGLVKDFTVVLDANMYVSPTTFMYTSDYFLVRTYTNNNLVIDDTDTTLATTKAIFPRTCDSTCKTCPTTDAKFCLTCYTENTGIIPNINYGGFNIRTTDGLCVDVCAAGYYISSGVCTPCISPCSSCTTITACTSCVVGFFYTTVGTTVDTRCRSTCPSGTYANDVSKECLMCSPDCATCLGLSNICTSCTGVTFLSVNQCVTFCPTGFFKNTFNNQCTLCATECVSCLTSTITCDACKPGYFLLSGVGSRCINNCPHGLVKNEVTGNCQCSSSCATCVGTLDTCLTCNGNLTLSGNACVSQCPSQTYKPEGLSVCLPCLDTGCSVCSATTCTYCINTFHLYSGACLGQCPMGTTSENRVCIPCPTNCASCPIKDVCTECFNSFLKEGSNCVSTCSAGLVNFNATTCVASCPIGYDPVNGRCQVTKNNTNNTNQTALNSRIIPFPYTISYALVVGIGVGMTCLYPKTLMASVIMSFGSILEIMSIITLIIVGSMELKILATGLAIVLAGLILIYCSNLVALIMMIKVLHSDTKFMTNYKKKQCPSIIIRIISVCSYHKFHQIVFSNIFGIKIFSNKVEYVRRLYPFNVLIIISFVLSLVVVVGASLVGYDVQALRLRSSTFIQSIDCIIIVVLNIIPTILVLRRKDKDYQKDIDDKEAKRYQTQDQLNMHNDTGGIQDVFIQDGGDAYGKSRISQSRKNYFYQNGKKSQVNDDPYQSPLDRKKLGNGNPINAESSVGDKSSESLLFNGDKTKIKSNINPLEEVSQEIQEIALDEPTRDNMIFKGPNDQDDEDDGTLKKNQNKNQAMLNYTGYDLDPRLLNLNENSEQFKKLPSQTKAKIRLAKANMQINKNSKFYDKGKKTIENGYADVEQIQLSPKKNRDQNNLFGSRINTSHYNDNDPMIKENSQLQSSPKTKISKSKQKRHNIVSNSKDKRYGNEVDDKEKGEQPQARLVRNQSQQIKKKDVLNQGTKTTKSQQIKKKKKQKSDIKVLYNGTQDNGQEQVQRNQLTPNDVEYEEDQPRLPVFQHKSKSKGKRGDNMFEDSDGLDDEPRRGHLSSRAPSNLESHQLKNLRAQRGQRTIPNQNPDDLPQMHATSQQLSNLVIVNRALNNRKSIAPDFSNDDSSIYKKIYNDETETLKSVQGDNMFSNEISPSHFNVQNQRFEDSSASNDMPIPATFQDIDEDMQGHNKGDGDGFDEKGSYIRRYDSSHNIDYDSVLSKKINNERIKELQKIYLPRLEVIKPTKKKKK